MIIDKETDFGLLMKFYLAKRNCNVYYCHDLNEGLNIIELKLPDIIIINLNHNEKGTLQNKLDAIDNYTPTILPIDTN